MNKREQRLRRKARAALRIVERDLAQAVELRDIALAAIRYVEEIYAPNLREPFSIANRRADLVERVRALKARRGATLRSAAIARRAA